MNADSAQRQEGQNQTMDSKLNSQESQQDKAQFENRAEQAVQQIDTAFQGEQVNDNAPPNLQSGNAETPGKQNGKSLTLETLPQDAKNALPKEAQPLFIAAYNSILDNNGDKEAAARVAWQTIETNEHYERSSDGKWQRVPDTAAKKWGDKIMIHETAS